MHGSVPPQDLAYNALGNALSNGAAESLGRALAVNTQLRHLDIR
jgi:hypothetical protein